MFFICRPYYVLTFRHSRTSEVRQICVNWDRGSYSPWFGVFCLKMCPLSRLNSAREGSIALFVVHVIEEEGPFLARLQRIFVGSVLVRTRDFDGVGGAGIEQA